MKTVRLDETSLRNVIRKIVSEQTEATGRLTERRYTPEELSQRLLSKSEDEMVQSIIDEILWMGRQRPPRSRESAMKLVMKAAQNIGGKNIVVPDQVIEKAVYRVLDLGASFN